ncbi:PepSY domain-containing protein [Bacillus sp. SCS-153A]|uniref:PepSY domain-containing protein n=1 Tax=Rossellomorea sedimentorum TaxID=3115294 RepID=UPI003905E67F
MKKAVLLVILTFILLGGIVAFTAGNSMIVDSVSQKKTQSNETFVKELSDNERKFEHLEIELDEEHKKTFYKNEGHYSSGMKTGGASEITVKEAETLALREIQGTVIKVEKEFEHGKIEYKFKLQTDSGETEVRVDAVTGEISRIKYKNNKEDDKREGKQSKE